MTSRRDFARPLTVTKHLAFIIVALGVWEWSVRAGHVNPTFYGQPSKILRFLWVNFAVTGELWGDLAVSVGTTLIAFVAASGCAILLGLLFVMFPRLEGATEPYFSAFNAMPRIALAPLFLLWFGLGIGSKVAIGFSLTFFIVLSSTVAGIRGANADHIVLARTLGVTGRQMFTMIALPGATPMIFSGLRLGLIYAMLGVIGGEIIAAEHGLGQRLAYLAATFDMSGVMALLLVLALLGMSVSWAMTRLERHLLRWQ